MRALGWVLAAALAGCALDRPPSREDNLATALPNLKPPPSWTTQAGLAQPVGDGWLGAFHDAQLEALVTEALRSNPDMLVAAARVEQAAGFVRSAGATLYPQVSALARGGGTLSGDSSGLQGAGIFA